MVDVSAVIATADRMEPLALALESLAGQGLQPREVVVVDASSDDRTREFCKSKMRTLRSSLSWVRAESRGAAAQRNQGCEAAAGSIVWFFDDDIVFEKDCARLLWSTLQTNERLGGVSAMIANQSYSQPGTVSRMVFTLLNGGKQRSFAGKIIGPAVNLLPEDDDTLPEVASMEWLNATCTMYRREALPSPPFDTFFVGYSFMEDVALSRRVLQKGWGLANARRARIIHRSEPGTHKHDCAALAEMELRNRRYVMEEILGRCRFSDYLRFFLWESFAIASGLTKKNGLSDLGSVLLGKMRALFRR